MGKIFGSTEPEAANGTSESISFLDKLDRLEGTLELAGTFRIESEVKGTVRCKKQLIVGKSARIEGEIEAAIVTVAGKVNGNVRGTDRVEILPTGVLVGEVETPCLVVEPGGILNARSNMPTEGVEDKKGVLEMDRFVSQSQVQSERQPTRPKRPSATEQSPPLQRDTAKPPREAPPVKS